MALSLCRDMLASTEAAERNQMHGKKAVLESTSVAWLLCAEMISEHGVIIHVQLGNKADVDK